VDLQKKPSQYIKENFVVTTSGVCANAPLLCSIEALGEDNVLFSVDYPYESSEVAANFIDTAPISESARAKICHENARRILKL
jgi:2,3-dihydroxybenzoate decarboxylase